MATTASQTHRLHRTAPHRSSPVAQQFHSLAKTTFVAFTRPSLAHIYPLRAGRLSPIRLNCMQHCCHYHRACDCDCNMSILAVCMRLLHQRHIAGIPLCHSTDATTANQLTSEQVNEFFLRVLCWNAERRRTCHIQYTRTLIAAIGDMRVCVLPHLCTTTWNTKRWMQRYERLLVV